MLVIIISLWFAMVGEVHAQSGGIAEVRLLSKSSSGQSVLLNVGELDHVIPGDHGVIMRRVLDQDKPGLRVIPIANGRVIRVGKNRSLWYLWEIKEPTQLILRDNYIVTTMNMSLKGRRKIENERWRVIDEKEELPATLNSKKQGDKDLLSLRKDDYIVVKRMHKLGESYEKDGALVDADEWVSVDKNGQQKYPRAMWRSSSEADFANDKRLETFHKVVANYLTRINDPAFNYGDFYWEQTREATGQFRIHSTSRNQYQAFLDEEQKRMSKDTELYKELLDKGQAWSSDYSDEELASMLDKVGIIYERERRRSAAIRSYNWQMMGNIGFNLLDNENRADSENARKAKWALELGAEWFPAPRHESVQKLAIWSSVRYVEDGVSIGDLNARSQEYSFGLGMTYHMFNSPFTMEQNIPFIGIGLRTGVTQLTTPSNGDEANYSMLSFPVVTGGLKYNLRSGIGLRVAASFEKLILQQTEANTDNTGLPQREEILEGRLSFGVTKLY